MLVAVTGDEAELAKAAPGVSEAVIRTAASVIGKTVTEARALAEAEGLFFQAIPEDDDEHNYVLEMNRNPNRLNVWSRKGVVTSIIRIGNSDLR
jgi:hypothetical protein